MVSEKDCLFCKIVKGEIPSKKVYEDENVIAFLDINPASKGHTLVVPKKHCLNIFDIDEEVLKNVITAVKKVATMIKEKLSADGINILQNNGQRAGQIVEHFHFHIIPRYKDDKIAFIFPREAGKPEELEEVCNILSSGNSKNELEEEFDSNW